MKLSAEQMDQVLDQFAELAERDENVVAIEFDMDGEDEVSAVVIRHLDPDKLTIERDVATVPSPGAPGTLPIVVRKSDPIEFDLATDDEPSLFDQQELFTHTLGMSGTKVSEGGYWGTLCLSGSRIRSNFQGRVCELQERFICSNSHVFHGVERTVYSLGRPLGRVTCLYDLEATYTFDFAIARGTSNLDPDNAFTVYNPNGPNRRIEALRTVEVGDSISKQGAKTGWSSGTAKWRATIRITGHRALYRCWRGTYNSAGGDSGSPILHQEGAKWYLVGIHFSSGPYFHSWNNAAVTASR